MKSLSIISKNKNLDKRKIPEIKNKKQIKSSPDITNENNELYHAFISKSVVGICRFELQQPVTIKHSKQLQLRQLLNSASLAEYNNAIAKTNGYSKSQDLIGKSIEEIFPGTKMRSYLKQFISSNYTLTDAEVSKINYKGEEKYYLINLVGIIEDGAVKRIWGTLQDITQQKKSEQALKHTQQTLNLALSFGSVATWIWDTKTNKLEWTKELQLLYGLKECPHLCGYKDWLQLIHLDDITAANKEIKNAIEQKNPVNIEFRIILPDQSVSWILFKANPEYDEKDNLIFLAGVNIDITNRKKLEKERDDFIVIASHELKTPLTSLKIYIEVLNEMLATKNDEKLLSISKKLEIQIDRLNNLIKDLLDVTNISGGQLELKQTTFDFNELITEVVDDLQPATLKHALIKHMNIKNTVTGDRNKMREVLFNLISNAIKYSPAAHKVIISGKSRKKDIHVSIKDFGIGVSKTDQHKIFDRFFRVSDSTSTFPGLGFGLYISSEIIKRHNGTIWVQSNKNVGSTFHFTLPLQ